MPTDQSSPQIAEQLVNNVKSLPLWVKQVIYLELRNELNQHFTPATLENITLEDTVALYVPVSSFRRGERHQTNQGRGVETVPHRCPATLHHLGYLPATPLEFGTMFHGNDEGGGRQVGTPAPFSQGVGHLRIFVQPHPLRGNTW